MNLYVDIGNSRIRLVQGDGVGRPPEFSHGPGIWEAMAGGTAGISNPGRILVANVAGDDLAAEFSCFCERHWLKRPEFIRVAGDGFGIRLAYENTRQLGVDRWLAMIAAWHKYRSPVCIFDCGSAVTADIVAAGGRHLGGYIIPGAYMMQTALATNTALIRTSADTGFTGRPGRSTEECICNGTVYAVVSLIEYVMHAVNGADADEYTCIVTGGGADTVMNSLAVPFRYEPSLVIDGIRLFAGD